MKAWYSALRFEAKIGLAALAAYLLYLLWVKNKAKLFPARPQGGDVNPSNFTFPKGEYKNLADRMEGAMSGLFNLNKTEVFSVLNSMRTADDLRELLNAFGIRHTGPRGLFNPVGDDWSLTQWLANAFSGSDLQAIKNKFNNLNVNF